MAITLPPPYNNAPIRPADVTQTMIDLYNVVAQINAGGSPFPFDLSGPNGSSLIGTIASGTGAVPRTQQSKNRDTISLADFDNQADAVIASIGKRLVVDTNDSVTLNIPSQFSSLQQALTAINGWVILGSVTIQFADGTYTHTTGVTINHEFGEKLRIVGNESTPANCVIQVALPNFDCLTVSNGYTLGYFNGFTLFKTVKATASDNSTALLSLNGSTIICGTNVVVNNWYYGIAARDGSFIYAPSAFVDNSGDVGIWAFVNSTIDCPSAISNNTIDVANSLGFGIQAEYGSAINCQAGSTTGCLVGGIASLSNSMVRAFSCTANSNTGSGFFVRDGATIEANGSTANTNTRYGIEVINDGHVYFSSFTSSGNTIGNFSPKAYFANSSSLGARIVADDGSMRIDNSGANSTFFNTSGGLQLEVRHTSTATSNFAISGGNAGNGNQPTLLCTGAATNIPAKYQTKGTGTHFFSSSSGVNFAVIDQSGGTPVNSLQATGSVTGSSPRLLVSGTDTNVDLTLVPQGTGVLRFGSFTAGGDTVSNGFITIKDSGGTLRKIMITA